MKFLGGLTRFSRRKFLLLAGISTAAVIVGGLIVYNNKSQSTEDYYYTRLSSLNESVASIPKLLESSGNTETVLNDYENRMDYISDTCQELSQKSKSLDPQKTTDSTKASVEKTNKLCADLTSVVLYSSNLYATLRGYLLFSAPSTSAEPVELGAQLTSAAQIIDTTRQNLSKVDNTRIKDPALQELQAQINEVQALAVAANKAWSDKDYPKARTVAANLFHTIDSDKQDFLSARSYFWVNTIGLNQLQESIANLKDQFQK